MLYRKLGNSGLNVSCIGIGTWVTFGNQINDELAEELLTVAYENGVNYFDTAEVYAGGKAEIVLGNILKKKKWRRSTYVVSTKIFWGGRSPTESGLSRKHIIEGLNGSLQRLQLDYVDVVFANKSDPSTPMEEIVRSFTHLINQGKAMYWATANWTCMEIVEACTVAKQLNLIAPIVNQTQYNVFNRSTIESADVSLTAKKTGITSLAWSPLGGGMYTGKYGGGELSSFSRAHLKGYGWMKEELLSDEGRRHQAKLKELEIISDKVGCTLAQMLICWCLRDEAMVCGILTGATSPDQLYENLKSLSFLSKIGKVSDTIDQVLGNKPT